MSAAEKRHVEAMVEWGEAERSQYAAQSLQADPFEVAGVMAQAELDGPSIDPVMVERAIEVNEAAVESAATQFENDDAGFLRAIKEIINGNQNTKADEGGSTAPATEAGPPAEGRAEEVNKAPDTGAFSLEQQTEQGLRDQAMQRQKADSDAAAVRQTAERKAESERDAADFALTGSDRPADVGMARGQRDMLADDTPATEQVMPASHLQDIESQMREGTGNASLIPTGNSRGSEAMQAAQRSYEGALRDGGWFESDGTWSKAGVGTLFLRSQGALAAPIVQFEPEANAPKSGDVAPRIDAGSKSQVSDSVANTATENPAPKAPRRRRASPQVAEKPAETIPENDEPFYTKDQVEKAMNTALLKLDLKLTGMEVDAIKRKLGVKGATTRAKLSEQAAALMRDNPQGTIDAWGLEMRPEDAAAIAQMESDRAAELEAANQAANARSEGRAERIEDFGEKLGGARKDVFRNYRDALSSDMDMAKEPLSRSFPKPNLEKLAEAGVEPKTLAYLTLLRGSIPRKATGRKLRRWAAGAQEIRSLADKLLSGEITTDDLESRIGLGTYPGLSGLPIAATVVSEMPPSDMGKVSTLTVEKAVGVRFVKDGENWKEWYEVRADGTAPRSYFGSRNDPDRVDVRTAEEALKAARKMAARLSGKESTGNKRSKLTAVSIYSKRSDKRAYLGFKGRGVVLLPRGFDTASEARQYLADNREAVQAEINEMRSGPEMRGESNAERVGSAHRDGPVTKEQFESAFGFRGVEFGNYVEQGRRQSDLNDGFDALMDLAEATGLPPRALSLGGQLGLAFAARGQGGKNPAKAHYEPDAVVINLTKKSGPGSLAHEWLHALDNYFGKQGGKSRYASESGPQSEMREQVEAAWKQVKSSMEGGAFSERSAKFDEARSKPYWNTTIEKAARGFEKYIKDKLAASGTQNDFLVNINEETGAYPTDAEMQGGIREAFDQLLDAIETRQEGDSVVLFRRDTGADAPMSSKDVLSAISEMTSDWENAPDIVVIDSMEQAPDLVREAWRRGNEGGAESGDVKGFYAAGKVYVVADAVTSKADLYRTIAHEVLGHGGLRAMYGASLNQVLDQFAETNPKMVAEMASKYGLNLERRGEKRLAAEEAIVKLAESTPDDSFVSRLVDAIRQALRSLGLKVPLSRSEIIRNYIIPAREFVQRGGAVQGDVRSGIAFRIKDAEPKTPIESARAKIAPAKTGLRSVIKAMWESAKADKGPFAYTDKDALITATLDDLHPIKVLDSSIEAAFGEKSNTYALSRIARATPERMHVLLHHGMLKLDKETATFRSVDDAGNPTRENGFLPQLRAILKNESEINDWLTWMVGRRSNELLAKSKENLFSRPETDAMLALGKGRADFEKAAALFKKFNSQVLDIAVESGYLDPKARERFESDFYLPFHRMMSEGLKATKSDAWSRGLAVANLKRLLGGKEVLRDPLENIVANWSHLIDSSSKTIAAAKAIDSMKRLGLAERITPKLARKNSDAESVAKSLRAAGVEVGALPESMREQMIAVWIESQPMEDGVVSYFEGGAKKYYRVTDPALHEAMAGVGLVIGDVLETVLKPLTGAKNLVTFGATNVPAFWARSAIRETMTAAGVARDGVGVLGYIDGLQSAYMQDQSAVDAMAAGGTFVGSYLDANNPAGANKRMRRRIRMATGEATAGERVAAYYGRYYYEIGVATDNAARLSVYRRAIEAGRTPLEAAIESRDLMDYSMRGASNFVAITAMTVPFLNPRLQGLYKLGRSASSAAVQKRLAVVTTLLTLASAALYALNHDDERYKKLEPWDRDGNWHVFAGDMHIRIPKPFEIGAAATVIGERLPGAAIEDGGGRELWDSISHAVLNTLNLDPTPVLLKIGMDLARDRDSFRDRPIVGKYNQNSTFPESESGPYTPSAAIKFAEALPDWAPETMRSPDRVNFLVNALAATVGRYAMDAASYAIDTVEGVEKPAKTTLEKIPTGGFIRDARTTRDRAIGDFYNRAGAVRDAMPMIREAEGEIDSDAQIAKIEKRIGMSVEIAREVDAIARDMSALRKESLEIRADDTLSPETKRILIDALQGERNVIAREGLSLMRGAQ